MNDVVREGIKYDSQRHGFGSKGLKGDIINIIMKCFGVHFYLYYYTGWDVGSFDKIPLVQV